MTTDRRTAPRPICPLELEVGKTYTDTTDGSTFTVAIITLKGVAAQITATDGTHFTYGGLYRGLTEGGRAMSGLRHYEVSFTTTRLDGPLVVDLYATSASGAIARARLAVMNLPEYSDLAFDPEVEVEATDLNPEGISCDICIVIDPCLSCQRQIAGAGR